MWHWTEPGPGLPKPKCPKCDKTVRCNQKRLICQLCLDVPHANFVNLKHPVRNSRDAESWTCNDCLFHVLPFKNYDDTIGEILAAHVSPKYINTHHIESSKHHHRHIFIAHLNTQSLASTFDAFHLMLENHKFDIVALSETWLKDNKHQYKYVQIPGYNTVFRNRENKMSGGVGFYVKYHLSFTLRNGHFFAPFFRFLIFFIFPTKRRVLVIFLHYLYYSFIVFILIILIFLNIFRIFIHTTLTY